jgi:hypothetical protein
VAREHGAAGGKATGGEDDRGTVAGPLAQRGERARGARGLGERVRQPRGVEAPTGGAGVLGGPLADRRAEPLEPGQVVVEALVDQPLQRRVAAGALGAEVLEAGVAPDHAAREAHRSPRAGELLE